MHDNPQQAVLWAYIAGIVDGEGSFRMQMTKPNAKCFKDAGLQYANPKYSAQFCLGMVDKCIPDLIHSVTGFGNVREERVPNRRSIWRIAITGSQKLPKFIKQVLPYLRVKKAQALAILEFYEGMNIPYNRKNGLDDKELRRREELYHLVKKLNACGAAATTEYSNRREPEATV